MPPIEFIVEGTPLSAQAKHHSRRKWKLHVAASAHAALPNSFSELSGQLRVLLYVFFTTAGVDIDNVLKPILDAMTGVVYLDDGQVIDVIAAKRYLGASYGVADLSPILTARLKSSETFDFVFISVDMADARVLP
ncbi:MAG: RusA family crossover junction endodeoxyribonuclease [Planctomycetaceae bacterium]